MTLTLDLSKRLERALQTQADAQGISPADAQGISPADFIEQVLEQVLVPVTRASATPELPILHLGAMSSLHRRDIYGDVIQA